MVKKNMCFFLKIYLDSIIIGIIFVLYSKANDMKFTSEIVRTANKLTKMYGRSEATKMAFQIAKSRDGYGYSVFCKILADGWTVRVKYSAEKYAGEVVSRLAGSVSAAIQAGLCEVLGVGPTYEHLHTYYDCDRQEIRKFRKANFRGFEIV